MVKTRVTDQGLINEPGAGFEGVITRTPSQTLTANATLSATDAGVIILSASQGVLTITLPTVSDPLGSLFAFRSTSPSAHVITSSRDAGNVITAGIQGLTNVTGTNASSVTMGAITGAAVTFLSDGAHWMVLGSSGSLTFAKGV